MQRLSKSIFITSGSKNGAIDEDAHEAILARSDRERLLQYDNDPMAQTLPARRPNMFNNLASPMGNRLQMATLNKN